MKVGQTRASFKLLTAGVGSSVGGFGSRFCIAGMAPSPVALSLPPWQRRIAKERSSTRLEQTAALIDSHKRELAAEARVAHLKAKIQREKHAAARREAVREAQERKRQAAREVAEESDRLVGRDVTRLLADAPMPDDIEVVELSQLFNEQLVKHCPPEQRDFFKLFKAMDLDGSHRISFAELTSVVRSTFRVSERVLPADRLAALWKALDANASGYIDSGELARFLRRGQDPEFLSPAQLARQRLLESRRREAAAAQADTDALYERSTVAAAAAVEGASAEEMRKLAELFQKQMGPRGSASDLSSHVQRLFTRTDRDGTGLVTLDEFARMVRTDLRLGVAALPETRLLALWKGIDANENGFITAGEFGRFLRAAIPADERASAADRHMEESIARRDNAMHRRANDQTRLAAKAALTQAQAMEAEAARLEESLRELLQGREHGNDHGLGREHGRQHGRETLREDARGQLPYLGSSASSPKLGGTGRGAGRSVARSPKKARGMRKARSEQRLRLGELDGVSSRIEWRHGVAGDTSGQPDGDGAAARSADGDDGVRLVAEALHDLAKEVGSLGRKAAAATARVAASEQSRGPHHGLHLEPLLPPLGGAR